MIVFPILISVEIRIKRYRDPKVYRPPISSLWITTVSIEEVCTTTIMLYRYIDLFDTNSLRLEIISFPFRVRLLMSYEHVNIQKMFSFTNRSSAETLAELCRDEMILLGMRKHILCSSLSLHACLPSRHHSLQLYLAVLRGQFLKTGRFCLWNTWHGGQSIN